MKVLIAAGGTGGHIYPGIAVAKEVLRRDPSSEIIFVGTARGLEKKIVPENGFTLSVIKSTGLKSVGVKGKFKGLMLLPKSFYDAGRIIKDFRPDVVVGAGGYVSGPVLLTAKILGYPTMVMESNALPGFTNRQLSRFVDKAALSFEAARPYFGNKGVVTGNPVRKEFFEIVERKPERPMRVLVFGGSQGSLAINDAMVEALPILQKQGVELDITHQTGDSGLEKVESAYKTHSWKDADIRPYISNIVESFEAADIIICRAGATTCAEVAAAGKAALMIPFPGAADDHQRKNAEALVERNAARMILQAELTGERLAGELLRLVNDPETVIELGRAARSMARPDAAKAAVDILESLRK